MHIKHLDMCRQKGLSVMSAVALAAAEGAETRAAGGSGPDGWHRQLRTLLKSNVNYSCSDSLVLASISICCRANYDFSPPALSGEKSSSLP